MSDDAAGAETGEEQVGSAPDRRAAGTLHGGAVPIERSGDLGAAIRRLLGLLRPERLKLLLILVLAIGGAAGNVVGPRLLGRATDVVIQGVQSGSIDDAELIRVLLTTLALYAGSWALAVASTFLLAGVVQRLMYRLRRDAEEKIHRLPLRYVDRTARGDLLSRVTNDVDNLAQSLQQTMGQMLSAVLLIIGVGAMMFLVSPVLALVAVVIAPVSLVLTRVVAGKARPKFLDQWKYTGELNTRIEETFTGHEIMKAYGRREEVEREFRETNDQLFEASFAAQFMSSLMQPLTMLLGSLQYAALAVVGGLRVASGNISVGDVQALLQYSRSFTQPLTQLASVMNVFQSGIASLERLLGLLDAEEEEPDGPRHPNLGTSDGRRVVFEDVSFSYEPDRPLIGGLSLVAEPGETVAIVGPTGAGKTTLVNLLMRFYELDGGRIIIDDHDIAELPRHELRSQMGMVLQDTWTFGGTIRENIAYGRPDASEADILAAAEATYVDRFVHSLPDGYDTVLGEEGKTISTGEKQLLTIARAFLADPSVLILDEATSSVDTRTEALVQEAMSRLRSNRTSFVIAHRLSTIRGADTIVVMEDGGIIEQGHHDDLVRREEGAYQRLYRSQFEAPVLDAAPAPGTMEN